MSKKKLLFLLCLIFSFQDLKSNNIYNSIGKERYIVISNDSYLFEKPSLESRKILKLYYGDIVYLVAKSNQNVQKNNNKSLWIKVIVENRKRLNNGEVEYSMTFSTGWLPDSAIVYTSIFRRVNKWDFEVQKIYVGMNDNISIFKINKDGDVIIEVPMCSDEDSARITKCNNAYKGTWNENNCNCLITGHLYQYIDFYWIKLDKKSSFGYAYLYINKKGVIRGAIEGMSSVFNPGMVYEIKN